LQGFQPMMLACFREMYGEIRSAEAPSRRCQVMML